VAVDQRRLISVMRGAVSRIEERYDGYRDDLFDYLSQIVMLEREHQRQATQIQKKVGDKVSALGTYIYNRAEMS